MAAELALEISYCEAAAWWIPEHACSVVEFDRFRVRAAVRRANRPKIRAAGDGALRNRLRTGCDMPRRQGAQGHRRDQGAAPQEGLRGARRRTGLAGHGDPLKPA